MNHDLIKAKDAARILGMSPSGVTRLIQRGVLKVIINPLSQREKLVSRKAVERLACRFGKRRVEEPENV